MEPTESSEPQETKQETLTPTEGIFRDTSELTPEQEAERRAFINRLEAIVRSISRRPKLHVTTEVDPVTKFQMAMEGRDAEMTWYRQTKMDPVTRKVVNELVHLPKSMENQNENTARGAAAHEAGHVVITRSGEFVPPEVMQEIGFHSLLASVEERPTDNVVRVRYAGAGEWVDECRKSLIEQAVIAIKTRQMVGYLPKYSQLCDMIVFERYYAEKRPTAYDEDVVELYRTIEPHIIKAEATLPEESASESEILEKAVERYRITYQEIWPQVQFLLEQDRETETLRQIVLQDMEIDRDNPEHVLNQLPEELREELEKYIAEAEALAVESEQPENETISEHPEDFLLKAPATEESSIDTLTTHYDFVANRNIPIPVDKMSPELKKALKEIHSRQQAEKRRKIEKRVKQVMRAIEDIIVEIVEANLTNDPPPTHKTYRIRMQQQEEGSRRKKKEEENRQIEDNRIKEEMKEIERKLAAQNEAMRPYEEAYNEVRNLDHELYTRLEEIFDPSIKRSTTYKSAGSRVNLQRVFRWQSSRAAGSQNPDSKIFEAYHIPEKKDYAITLLVDLSGSMQDSGKIDETFKAVILLSEVLNRLGVRFEVVGFQDETILFKSYDEELTDQVRERMGGMKLEPYGINPGGHNWNDGNDDGPCLAEASRSLGEQPNKEKFLLVFSDGQPAGRRSNSQDLKDAVKNILQETDQKLIGLGLGRGTQHVATYYPFSIPDINVHQLAEVLGDLIEGMVNNPENYVYQPE